MFRQMKTNEVALLLQGLRSIHVSDEMEAHKKLTRLLEAELASRGARLLTEDEKAEMQRNPNKAA